MLTRTTRGSNHFRLPALSNQKITRLITKPTQISDLNHNKITSLTTQFRASIFSNCQQKKNACSILDIELGPTVMDHLGDCKKGIMLTGVLRVGLE